MSRSIWAVLGIKSTRDRDIIRRAYAAKLRVTNPEDDPESFMALRQAYEAALERARQPEPAFEAPDPAEPAAPTAPPPPDPAEIARAAEEAALAACRNRLVQLLEAPLLPAPEALIAAFESILATPLMTEIGVRSGTEDWLAHVIAGNLPRADPLVAPAMAAFGWRDDAASRRWPPAVDAVLRRHAEGVFAQDAARPHAPLHLGWTALTTPPGTPWQARAKAFVPGRPREVAIILANADGELPGLHDWFNTAALAWWRRHFERERVTAEMFYLPLLIAIAAIFTVKADTATLVMGVLLIVFAAPALLVRFVKQPQRDWAETPWDRPAWHFEGWMAPLAALPLFAAFVPQSLIGVIAVAVAALFVLGWTTIATPLPRNPSFWHRIIGILRIAGPLGILAATARAELTVLYSLAWAVVTLTLVIAWWRGGDAIAERVHRALPRYPATIIVVFTAAMLVGGIVAASGLPSQRRIYSALLCISAAIVLLYLANRLLAPGRSRRPFAIGCVVVFILGILAIGSAFPTAPRIDAQGPPIAACPTDDRAARQPGIASVPLACGTGTWITPDDYPAAARHLGLEGTTAIRLSIDARGAVADCTITAGSGSAVLDNTTCKLANARARFLPALDAGGKPVPGKVDRSVRWELAQ